MKSFTRLGWLWVAVLTVVTAISGCQTESAWRMNGPRGDTVRVSEGAIRDRTCRFG